MKHLRRALSFFKPDALRVLAACLFLGAGVGANLLKPWPLAVLIDSVLSSKPLPSVLAESGWARSKGSLVLVLAVTTILLHFAHGTLSAAQNYLSIQISLRGLRRVRQEVFACLQTLSLRFHQSARSGDLVHRAAWDSYAFQTLFQQGLMTSLTAVISLVLMVGVMIRLNVALTLVALAVVPPLLIMIPALGRVMRGRGLEAQRADSRVTSHIQETIAALPLIQSYTLEEREKQAFERYASKSQECRGTQHRSELFYWWVVTLLFALGTGALIWIGAEQVIAGKLTVGGLLIFLAYLAQFHEPLNQLSHVGVTVSTATAGIQRVFELLDTPREVVEPARSEAVPVEAWSQPFEGKPAWIEFCDVNFGYHPDQAVLRTIKFEVAAGESVALIGPSGAGKTTLLHLLPRFFDPDSGEIRIGGVNLRKMQVQELRSRMALVLQEPLLLSASVAENIACGRPGATFEEIEAAARAARADEFIRKLPRKYETLVGEGGGRLSTGEKQRLNLARAFLKDAPILLLDEPTSALDTESEEQILAALANLMRKRTTLIVAHRLLTVRQVNRVLVMQDGRITESGKPEELLTQDGYFRRLFAQQVVRT